ncbi:MAG: MFS transporter [Micrococcus sp.]|nr:MFS transporter [Micrococcus sp.]
MFGVLAHPTYARLFSAQAIALLGTGLLTVALGLLAFEIAGGEAGVVLGTALAIKMIAYVAVSPVAAALTASLPRKPVLITADLVRAGVALALPFVSEAWQIYVLIFLLQSASATFTPTFQALIPQVLTAEREYTRGLALSRLAYDLEALASPLLAAALLTVMTYHELFVGTVIGFLVSASLVAVATLPTRTPTPPSPFLDRLTSGTRIMARAPELRGLLALNLAVAAGTAWVIVNTVVLVQADLARPQSDVALLLAANGAGSMLVALTITRVLDRIPDRRIMLAGAFTMAGLLAVVALMLAWAPEPLIWPGAIALWAGLGAANAAVLVPSARLLRRNTTDAALPGVFAAQFALSHACFLLTYPLAGWLGAALGLPPVAAGAAALALLAAVLARRAWRGVQTETP